jgi:hypothetical protein
MSQPRTTPGSKLASNPASKGAPTAAGVRPGHQWMSRGQAHFPRRRVLCASLHNQGSPVFLSRVGSGLSTWLIAVPIQRTKRRDTREHGVLRAFRTGNEHPRTASGLAPGDASRLGANALVKAKTAWFAPRHGHGGKGHQDGPVFAHEMNERAKPFTPSVAPAHEAIIPENRRPSLQDRHRHVFVVIKLMATKWQTLPI